MRVLPSLILAAALVAAALILALNRPADHWGDRADVIDDVAGALTERLHLARLDAGDPLLAERIIVVTGEINEVSGGLTCQKLLWLDRRDPGKPIDLYLRTNGGWIADALAVLDVMRGLRSRVNVHAIGTCESAGAMLLAGATGERVAWPQARIMVHVVENPGDEPASFDLVNRTMLEAFWRRHAALPEEAYPMRHDRMWYFTPEEALAHRIVDRIGDGLTPSALRGSSAP